MSAPRPTRSGSSLALGLGLVVFAVGLTAWKLSTRPPPEQEEAERGEAEHDTPRRSKWFWESDTPRPADEPLAVAAPRTHVFYDELGAPIVGAHVTLLRSPMFDGAALRGEDHDLAECDDYAHLTALAAKLREEGVAPEVLGEATTDGEGRVTFGVQAWPERVLVSVDRVGKPVAVLQADRYREDIVVDPPPPFELVKLSVFDDVGEPLPGARITLVVPLTGQVSVVRTDSSGTVLVGGVGTRWAIAESEGRFPSVIQVNGQAEEFNLGLPRLGSIEVVSSETSAFALRLSRRHPAIIQVKGGRGLIENVRPGYVSVEVTEPGLLGNAEGLLDNGGSLRLSLQVRRASRLLVTVIDQKGDPVPEVAATLSAPWTTVDAVAAEEGERLVLGPLAQGPGVLRVSAPGFKTRAQSVELAAGDTDLEVVLSEAPVVHGRVVNAQGEPVPEVAVTVNTALPNEPAGAQTDERGEFTLHVDEPGAWELTASGDAEIATATAQVPGPDVVLTLKPMGRAQVTVIGTDGRPAAGTRVLLASVESSEPEVSESNEEGIAWFGPLVPSQYHLQVEDGVNGDAFLTHQQEIEVHSGEEVTLTVRLRAGAKASGVLVDLEGNPVPYTALVIDGKPGRYVETGDDGTFTITGLEPGSSANLSVDGSKVTLKPSSLRAGAENVRVQFITGPPVSGRIVDVRGEPILNFSVNGEAFDTTDGRFTVKPNERDQVEVELYDSEPPLYRAVAVNGRTDVGDVVLKAQTPFRGVVMDEARRPLSSVRVVSAGFAMGEVLTDGEGRFETELSDPEASFRVEARTADLGTVQEVAAGTHSIELVLESATRVDGVVRGAGGRGLSTSVLVRGNGQEELQVDTDEQGRFSLSLAPGSWFFGTRSARSSRLVMISGRSQHVELGVPDESCEVTVRGRPAPTAVMLVPAGVAWAPTVDVLYSNSQTPAGVVELGAEGVGFVGRGLECGAWKAHAIYNSEVVSADAVLSPRSPAVVTVKPEVLSGGEYGGHLTGMIPMLEKGQANLEEILKEPPPQLVE